MVDKVFVVTGASGGVAHSILNDLSDRGQVIGLCRSIPDTDNFQGIKFISVDFTCSNDYESLISSLNIENKQIVFVHLAAFTVDKLFVHLEPAEVFDIYNTNVLSCFSLVKPLIPLMMAKKWGRIITFSSIVADNPGKGVSAYSSSKMALTGLIKSLASEYSRFGITSNSVSLGYFNSGLINTLSDHKVRQIIKDTPCRRLGSGIDILKAIDFIIDSDFFTGQNLCLNGGL